MLGGALLRCKVERCLMVLVLEINNMAFLFGYYNLENLQNNSQFTKLEQSETCEVFIVINPSDPSSNAMLE